MKLHNKLDKLINDHVITPISVDLFIEQITQIIFLLILEYLLKKKRK